MLEMVKKNPIHCQSECKLFQSLWKTIWRFQNNEILTYHIIQQSHFWVYIYLPQRNEKQFISMRCVQSMYIAALFTVSVYMHTHTCIYVYMQSHIYPHSLVKIQMFYHFAYETRGYSVHISEDIYLSLLYLPM